MAQVFKCRTCGEVVKSPDLHSCSKNFETVNLEPKEFCAKFGHSDMETPMPNTRKVYDRIARVSENEERLVNYEGHSVRVRCQVCGRGFERWKEKWLGY